MKPARRHATCDDVRDASDLLVAELIEGDLYDVLVPDLAGWRRERLPPLADMRRWWGGH